MKEETLVHQGHLKVEGDIRKLFFYFIRCHVIPERGWCETWNKDKSTWNASVTGPLRQQQWL